MSALKKMRQKRGLRQYELAHLVGVDPVTVSQWERGAWLPSMKHLQQIAGVLACKVSDILDDM